MLTARSLFALFISLSVSTSSVAALGDAQTFTLRHVHSTHADTGRIRWGDVPKDIVTASSLVDPSSNGSSTHSHTLDTQRMKVHRPISQDAFHAARQRRKQKSPFGRVGLWKEREQSLGWDEDDVEGPAVDKRETVLVLAKMTNNAYVEPNESEWYDLGGNWTTDHKIGWEPDADGFRGHVFLSADNATAILSIKGTSAGWLGGGGPTVKKDKLNDNLLFSCCCAHVDWTWSNVCGCFGGGNKCDENCVEDALTDESLFYPVGINLYNNLTFMYPDAKIWVIGHSLGGSLASLIGTTFGAPTVTFEAPGERMAARRLHLPMPPSTQHVTHIYHTADPIAMGTCNGLTSSCYLGGYAMESKCVFHVFARLSEWDELTVDSSRSFLYSLPLLLWQFSRSSACLGILISTCGVIYLRYLPSFLHSAVMGISVWTHAAETTSLSRVLNDTGHAPASSPPTALSLPQQFYPYLPVIIAGLRVILTSTPVTESGGFTSLGIRCHLGQSIIYDTITELHWSADIRTHGIVVVIEQLLNQDWSERTGKTKKGWWGRRKAEGMLWESDSETRLLLDEGEGERVEVPEPKPEDDCVECYAWEFGDYMNDTLRK